MSRSTKTLAERLTFLLSLSTWTPAQHIEAIRLRSQLRLTRFRQG